MRIQHYIFSILLACVYFSASATSEASTQEAPPNILFIVIDDMNDWAGFLGGHPQAITPKMDALARRGVNFTNAHCSAPACSPSRNSLLFGVEPFHSGLYAFYDHAAFPEEFMEAYQSIPSFFKQNGYHTYGSGKIHHRRVSTPEEWTEFLDFEQYNAMEVMFDHEAGYRKSKKLNFTPTLNQPKEHTDYQTASYGIDVLNRAHETPFFLAVGILKPHLPLVAPKEFFDRYPEPIDTPNIHPNDSSDIPAVGRSMIRLIDDRAFKANQAWNKVRRAYLACISWADYNVGRLIEALEASEYSDNTIVVLCSDHGYALGEKNHFRKFTLWEESTRVPFIIWDTREPQADNAREVKAAISIINTYRTLAELSGLTAPEYVDGFSLVPQLTNPAQHIPEPAICTWGRGNYSLRDQEWRYIRYYDGSEELYSHTKDPDEWNNLADDAAFSSIKEQMKAYLPKNERPMQNAGLKIWSVPTSADKPLK